ncbi:MAG TPA: hypothetical protein VHJ76_00770 [Actinomycetota bacterium]|nr:hypothetical protein [Actinomycetota bacterium]
MRSVAVALAAALVLAASPAVGASPAPSEIVLSGEKSAHIEVRLHRPVELACCRYVEAKQGGQALFRISGFEVATTGTYAGFASSGRATDGS